MYARAATALLHRDSMAAREGVPFGTRIDPEVGGEEHRQALVRVRILVERVDDDELRALVAEFVKTASLMSIERDETKAFVLMGESGDMQQRANKRIGELLRAL